MTNRQVLAALEALLGVACLAGRADAGRVANISGKQDVEAWLDMPAEAGGLSTLDVLFVWARQPEGRAFWNAVDDHICEFAGADGLRRRLSTLVADRGALLEELRLAAV